MRVRGFLRKEFLQIVRDPSSILLAIVMPVVLLFLFGFGMSLNPAQVSIAVVDLDGGARSRDLVARFAGSAYFEPRLAQSQSQAWVALGEVDGILQIPGDFSRRYLRGESVDVQLLLNGVDANRANLIRGYVTGALATGALATGALATGALATGAQIAAAQGQGSPMGVIALKPRTWFNPTGESRFFLVPGLIALIMTMIGTLLTALVIAREWERGTMEAILVTPLRTREFLLGKTLAVFFPGHAGHGAFRGGGRVCV